MTDDGFGLFWFACFCPAEDDTGTMPSRFCWCPNPVARPDAICEMCMRSVHVFEDTTPAPLAPLAPPARLS